MAPSKDPSPGGQSSDSGADLAQAYRDLARGEQAATALEANLNNLESKLDALLAAMDSIADDQPGAGTEKVRDGDASKDSECKDNGEGKDKSSAKGTRS